MNLQTINQASDDLALAIQKELVETNANRDNLIMAIDIAEKKISEEMKLLREYVTAHHDEQTRTLQSLLSAQQ